MERTSGARLPAESRVASTVLAASASSVQLLESWKTDPWGLSSSESQDRCRKGSWSGNWHRGLSHHI
jgi:hypothetical protein